MKKEIEKIIKENNLYLTVKNYMNSEAIIITDWTYWHHFINYQKSDLKKFKDLLSSKYSKRYREINAGVGGSIILMECIRYKTLTGEDYNG